MHIYSVNGCDFWFDGLPGMSWRHCCDLHDIAYTEGGDSLLRLAADHALAECVANVAGPMGVLMGLGVALFGWAFFRYRRLNGKNIWELLTGRKT